MSLMGVALGIPVLITAVLRIRNRGTPQQRGGWREITVADFDQIIARHDAAPEEATPEARQQAADVAPDLGELAVLRQLEVIEATPVALADAE
jgi:hypothetical protein